MQLTLEPEQHSAPQHTHEAQEGAPRDVVALQPQTRNKRGAALDANLPPLENDHCMTIMSNDPREAPCKGCGETRVIFQAHYFAFVGKPVQARCKSCHESMAAMRGGGICVKAVAGRLRQVWAKDQRLGESPASVKARAARKPEAPIRGTLGRSTRPAAESGPLSPEEEYTP